MGMHKGAPALEKKTWGRLLYYIVLSNPIAFLIAITMGLGSGVASESRAHIQSEKIWGFGDLLPQDQQALKSEPTLITSFDNHYCKWKGRKDKNHCRTSRHIESTYKGV